MDKNPEMTAEVAIGMIIGAAVKAADAMDRLANSADHILKILEQHATAHDTPQEQEIRKLRAELELIELKKMKARYEKEANTPREAVDPDQRI